MGIKLPDNFNIDNYIGEDDINKLIAIRDLISAVINSIVPPHDEKLSVDYDQYLRELKSALSDFESYIAGANKLDQNEPRQLEYLPEKGEADIVYDPVLEQTEGPLGVLDIELKDDRQPADQEQQEQIEGALRVLDMGLEDDNLPVDQAEQEQIEGQIQHDNGKCCLIV